MYILYVHTQVHGYFNVRIVRTDRYMYIVDVRIVCTYINMRVVNVCIMCVCVCLVVVPLTRPRSDPIFSL